jgi:hypothetical protein
MLSGILWAMLTAAQDVPPPVTVADKATLPSLAIDGDGRVFVAFLRNGNVEVAASADGGMTFEPPVSAIDTGGKAAPAPMRGPRLSVDKNKKLYVTAQLPIGAPPPGGGLPPLEIYAAMSSDRGKTWSKPNRINETPGTTALGYHDSAVSGSGELYVAYTDQKRGKGWDLIVAKASEGGKRVARTQAAANVCECAPAVTVDGKGNPVVAWREGPGRKTRQLFLANGVAAPSFAPPKQVNSVDCEVKACPREGPSLAAAGKIVACAWADHRDPADQRNLYWTTMTDGGKPAPDERAHKERGFVQGNPSLAVDAEGTVWMAWEDGRHTRRRAYVTDSKSRFDTALTGDADPPSGLPSVACGPAFTAVAFESADGVAFRIVATKP